MTFDSNDQGALTNAEQIIERFGGIRPMASKMAVPVTTVQGWKKRNVIPGNRRDDVLRAARVNDIDLSDLVKGTANQNAPVRSVSAPPSFSSSPSFSAPPASDTPSFGRAVDAAARSTDDAAHARHREAIEAGAASVPPPAAPRPLMHNEPSEDLIFGRMKKMERRAVQKSALISIVLVTAASSFGAFLLWPSQHQIADHDRRLGTLERQVRGVAREQSALERLIPSDFDQKYAAMESQARTLQAQVMEAARHAGTVAGTAMGPDAGTLAQRLDYVGQEIGQLRDAPALASMLEKFRMLQQTPEGQQQLSGTMADLNALVQNLQGDDEHLGGALAQAQQQDSSLGRTLDGVSPYDLKAAALLLGLAQFRNSLNRNAPFAEDLELLQNMVGDEDPALTEAIARLAPQAEKGVLTPEGLSDQLKGMTGDIVVSSLKGEDVTIRDKAMARLSEVLQVQKDGQPITGTDTQARIARAQVLLDHGDVQGALTELKALEGPAAETAAPLIGEAEATLLAEKVQQMFTGRVLGSLGGGADTGVTAGSGAGLRRVLGELEAIGGHRKVVGAPGSGFVILPPATKVP